jgi:hypothetical protein
MVVKNGYSQKEEKWISLVLIHNHLFFYQTVHGFSISKEKKSSR